MVQPPIPGSSSIPSIASGEQSRNIETFQIDVRKIIHRRILLSSCFSAVGLESALLLRIAAHTLRCRFILYTWEMIEIFQIGA
jgi:hypothetical protein